jgi:hypothetical protein
LKRFPVVSGDRAHAMNTDKAIEELASAFSKLSQPEHKDLFVCALEALVRLLKAEKMNEILADLEEHPEASVRHLCLLGAQDTRTPH